LAGEKGVTLVSATDHDSRAFTVALKKAMGSRGLTPAFHVEFDPGKNAAEAATRAKGAPAVALVAGPADSVRFLRALRASGFGGRIYAAAYAYDATNLVLDAIRELFPYTGASGEIRFDALGRNSHPVRLATVRGGRVITWTQSAAR
jgi:ABC-type branched-subunit amino acid transport system substrate-binding protein